jgi:hypothetical protein
MKMKNKPIRSAMLATLALSALSLGLAGCNKSDRDTVSDKAGDMYDTSKAAVADTWNDVKDYSFDKSNDFKQRAKAMSSDFDAKLSKLKADYSDAQASESRKAAWAQLKSDRADYEAKLDALGDATAATWESAKNNVIAAWDRMQADYDKAVADHT